MLSKRKGKLERAKKEKADEVAEKKKVKRAEKFVDEKKRRDEEKARRKSFEDFSGWRKQEAKTKEKFRSLQRLAKT